MRLIARLALPAAAVLLLALAPPATAQEHASEAAPSPEASAVLATPPPRHEVEHRDLSDSRFGNWIWPASMLFVGGLIAIGYILTPEPDDKLKRGYVTTSAGTFMEEDLV